jgi:hypothetical protein
MTATSAKKVEGLVEETSPTTITVSKKLIYIPQEKREMIKTDNIVVGESVRIIYDMRGNLISAEKIPKELLTLKSTPDKIIDADAEQKKKIYIQPPIGADKIPQSGTDKKSGVYTPSSLTNQSKDWISGKEKNDSIIIQSILARAVEIVNAQYRDYPEMDYKDTDFTDLLDTRCNHIENVADRLFAYVKKKVDDEQRKGKP